MESLNDCPRCHGKGYRTDQDDKLCPCVLENSQGFTPGKLPMSIAETITPIEAEEPNP